MNTPSNPTIGPYQVIKSLGKGGMGEVFLVHDPLCERKIALKKILPDLAKHGVIKNRFLKEARLAAQLSHPSIIPIYAICHGDHDPYYTMPYVEGETLKEIFKTTIHHEEKGLPPHEVGVSIPALVRIFFSVCQATAYAHSKSILHRDLKPENIMVGKYGEVFVLDWGIATSIGSPEDEEEILFKEAQHLTRPGKVLGTVNFMAPERALKQQATVQSEIYSLGVILYQILTLQLPFARKNLEHFRKIMKFETLLPPEELAPYRDIPKQLSLITQKCLTLRPQDRYANMQELIFDLENYIEGYPEWILNATLDIQKQQDWEFQEHVFLAKHLAITKVTDSLEWAGLMISKGSFSGNLKLETTLKLYSTSQGLGLLMCVPEPSERKGLEDGYCLWISPPSDNHLTLFRSNAEILSIPSIDFPLEKDFLLCIEKIDHSVRVYIDGALKLHYISHIPIIGTHLGLVYKNLDFIITPIKVYTGSQSVMTNCLCIPDAFLANKNFENALVEYQKIADSFQGRLEGREAQFRIGLTLIEQGKRTKHLTKRDHLFSLALEEFEKLKSTPGAPLEYLGKSFVYYALQDIEEEIKCLELSLRKYPNHPMLPVIKEQIIFRFHETSQKDRVSAYHFALLTLRHVQEIFLSPTHLELIHQLMKYSIPLSFIENIPYNNHAPTQYLHYATQLAFLTHKPLILLEIFDTLPLNMTETPGMMVNILFALLYMGREDLAKDKLLEKKHILIDQYRSSFGLDVLSLYLADLSAITCLQEFLSRMIEPLTFRILRCIDFIIYQNPDLSCDFLPKLEELSHDAIHPHDALFFYEIYLIALLRNQELTKAKDIFNRCSKDQLTSPATPLYFLYGIYTWCIEGENAGIAYFTSKSALLPLHPYTLAGLYLCGLYKDKELSLLLFWEKLQVYQGLELFYLLTGYPRKASEWRKKQKKLRY